MITSVRVRYSVGFRQRLSRVEGRLPLSAKAGIIIAPEKSVRLVPSIFQGERVARFLRYFCSCLFTKNLITGGFRPLRGNLRSTDISGPLQCASLNLAANHLNYLFHSGGSQRGTRSSKPRVTQPEFCYALQGFEEKCLSVSEFFSELQSETKRREPEGQGVRAYFFASFLWTHKEMKAPSGGATPRPFWLLIRIPEIHNK